MDTTQPPIPFPQSLAMGWRRKLILLVLVLMLWTALSGAVFAVCGSTFVNAATGADTAACGTAADPCRTVNWARQRAQSCSVATRIFTVSGSAMTLAEVVLPPAGTGDHSTPAWISSVFPFFGFLLNPIHYTAGVVDLPQ